MLETDDTFRETLVRYEKENQQIAVKHNNWFRENSRILAVFLQVNHERNTCQFFSSAAF
jgi:hypothetical protein